MGLFTPFAYLKNKVATFSPNNIANLTFWVDFSNPDFYTTSGGEITSITSKVGGSTSHTLNPQAPSGGGSTVRYSVVASLSNPSLNAARVTAMPTQYLATSYNTTDDNAIVQGPKTNTTSFPDGMTFFVYNKEAVDKLGYLIARFNGSTDRGVLFAENRIGIAPYQPTGVYDFGVTAPQIQYYNDNRMQNVLLVRENNGASRRAFTSNTLVAANANGNDTQNRTFRQFHTLGRYGTNSIAEAIPIGTHLCEVIQYNRVLTDVERNQVITYLSNKWNIQSPLFGTGGSVTTSGTQYFLVPTNDVFNFGTGDFTVEGFVKLTSGTAFNREIMQWESNGGFGWGYNSSNQLIAFQAGVGAVTFTTTLSANIWYHVAFSRSGGTLRAFVNGTQVGTNQSFTNNLSAPGGNMVVGRGRDSVQHWPGRYSNFRITKGVALYTSNFTAPTSPLSVTPNTSLLLLAQTSDNFTIDATGINTITNVGATFNTDTPFV